MRRLLLGITALLGLSVMTACSPPLKPLVAITMRDGQPTLVLVTCRGAFSQVTAFRNGGPSGSSSPDPAALVDWQTWGDAPSEIVEAAIFGEPPTGWETEYGDETDPSVISAERPTRLEPGVPYSATGHSSYDDGHYIDFTADDLARLESGMVMTTDEDGAPATMTYDDFIAQALEYRRPCKPVQE